MSEKKEDIKHIKHIEHEGFEFDVDMDNFDDIEFFELADELETNQAKIIDIAKLTLGAEGYNAMKEYFKKKDGKLKFSTVSQIFDKILAITDPKDSASGSQGKNTQTN